MEVRLVACADKLHNIRTIAADYEKMGNDVWKRFKRGKADQEWYYQELVKSLCNRSESQGNGSVFRQLKNEVEDFFGRI
jgi:hypothetical protein